MLFWNSYYFWGLPLLSRVPGTFNQDLERLSGLCPVVATLRTPLRDMGAIGMPVTYRLYKDIPRRKGVSVCPPVGRRAHKTSPSTTSYPT